MFEIRDAQADDLEFLRAMLIEAAYWRSESPRPTVAEGLAQPNVQKILDGWGREGDTAVIAISGEEKLGAAWYRLWTNEEHSYGYVDEFTPELGIGVTERHRGKGIGCALIEALVQRARSQGYTNLSLSVEKDNPSRFLYLSEGFEKVAEEGNAWTMILHIGAC